VSLSAALESVNLGIPLFEMLLTDTAVYSLSPSVEAGTFQLISHQLYNFLFRQFELKLNGFERGPVFPRHFNYPINFFFCQH
jgi:hypothetical protein